MSTPVRGEEVPRASTLKALPTSRGSITGGSSLGRAEGWCVGWSSLPVWCSCLQKPDAISELNIVWRGGALQEEIKEDLSFQSTGDPVARGKGTKLPSPLCFPLPGRSCLYFSLAGVT